MKPIPLPEFRLPDYPTCQVTLDTQPLQIIDHESFTLSNPTTSLAPAIGLATILHNWSPNSLSAFLDLDAWFSFTWIRNSPSSNIEIGRIGNQITFGTLDTAGEDWTLMLTFNICLEGAERGKWVPNTRESMRGEDDVTEPEEIERLARELVAQWVVDKMWTTGKGVKHKFFVEYAPMDVWGDGIPMDPHWLYESLNLNQCTSCKKASRDVSSGLQRCGKCGTATYCSAQCQKSDWAVHKYVCSLSLEDRGQMLAITEKGGLIGWDWERLFAEEGSGEASKNPCLREGVLKRWRKVGEAAMKEVGNE